MTLTPDFLPADLPHERGVFYLDDPAHFARQEAAYLRARDLEGRLYDDEVVRRLPLVPPGHRYANEWIMRADSAQRLHEHIAAIERPLTILDVGCGAAWMSNRLALLEHCRVLGLDINRRELEQGARVFAGNPDLTLAFGNVMAGGLPPERFDLIVLAASLQYFSSVRNLMPALFVLLREEGAIHILDTPFYDQATVADARERTRVYYEKLGVSEMTLYYHHHLWTELKVFDPSILYHPDKSLRRLRRMFFSHQLSPFPWLCIKRP